MQWTPYAPLIATVTSRYSAIDVVTSRNYNDRNDFEWDESGRKENLRKKGLDFRDTAIIIEGPMMTQFDTRTD